MTMTPRMKERVHKDSARAIKAHINTFCESECNTPCGAAVELMDLFHKYTKSIDVWCRSYFESHFPEDEGYSVELLSSVSGHAMMVKIIVGKEVGLKALEEAGARTIETDLKLCKDYTINLGWEVDSIEVELLVIVDEFERAWQFTFDVSQQHENNS